MVTSKEEILAQVVSTIKEISCFHINEKLDAGDPGSLHLDDDLMFDELDRVEMVMELEERFSVEISDEEITGYSTIGNVVDHIAGVLAKNNSK